MLSTILELVGFAALTAAAFLTFGLGAGLFVVAVECLIFGLALDQGRAAAARPRKRAKR